MTDLTAQAIVEALEPQFKSKAEERWSQLGAAILMDEIGVPSVWQMYEPIQFQLIGSKYKPDFMHILGDGRVVFIEVKGSKKQGSYRSSRVNLRSAAKMFPFFMWFQVIDDELEKIT